MNYFKLINWRVFIISFVITFLMVALTFLGIRPSGLISPSNVKRVDIFNVVEPRLERKTAGSFQLKKSAGIVQVASATAGDFDQASAYGVIDYNSGGVILSKNLSKRLAIASITKLMTAAVALDLAGPDEVFSVSNKATQNPPSKVMLRAGENFRLKDLLEAALISSANDAAQVIAEGIDKKYGGQIFTKAMNAKARFLGLKNTSFANPQGFDDPKNFSSVEDLSILTHYVLENYPLIAQTVNIPLLDLSQTEDIRFYLNNWNGLLGVYPGVSGVKIGNTEDAGYTTVVTSEREGRKLIAVLLGAPGVLERDFWTAQALDVGFQQSANLEPVALAKGTLKAKYSSWKLLE